MYCIRIFAGCQNTVYRKIFAETDLMVTDYSSVAFDFAYLKKPVLYFQFDQADFFGGQYGHGYYDYAKDGFGEVETELDAMAGRIAEYIDGGCRMNRPGETQLKENRIRCRMCFPRNRNYL